jgi:hypothetical protein
MKDELDTAVALEPPDADTFDARDEDRAGCELAYRPDGSARLYRTGDALPGEDVLEGFAVPVADLFAGVTDEPART